MQCSSQLLSIPPVCLNQEKNQLNSPNLIITNTISNNAKKKNSNNIAKKTEKSYFMMHWT